MYAVLNMGLLPSQFANLPRQEYIFVVASILTKLDAEKSERAKIDAMKK